MPEQKITTFLWFNTEAEQAAELYVSIFGAGSRIVSVDRWGEGGPVPKGTAMTVSFELAGQRYIALNGGPHFKFTEAISLYVSCDTQDEVDRLWSQLIAGGGAPSRCGWLKDRFGLSWQVIPSALMRLMRDPDPQKAARVTKAMLGMGKIEIAALERAHRGD
jgi:predicted 3-demethylubiquinone-9 3-methyltransferase (glyoxalase superfamily)